jgi:galactose mutarotase-like enzyme
MADERIPALMRLPAAKRFLSMEPLLGPVDLNRLSVPGGIWDVLRGWKPDGALRLAATLRDPASGRRLELLTDQPGLQVYTSSYLDGTLAGKGADSYPKQCSVCLETQTFPDTAHHPDWPTQRLDPGQTYHHTMVHRFTR